jgi:hypothetical protein
MEIPGGLPTTATTLEILFEPAVNGRKFKV